MREPVSWKWLGLCAYDRALAEQDAAWRARRAGGPDVCLMLEHPPTITLGRHGSAHDVLATPRELAARGVACHHVERGGQATYHAPGQLVVYPIVRLGDHGLGVRGFVDRLEAVMLAIAAAVGVEARRDPRGRGVWTARGKLGAVGIRVRDDVTTHGFALNVDLELDGYGLIAPCGTAGLPITSLRAEGAVTSVAELWTVARRSWDAIFARNAAGAGEARV